VTRTPLDPLKGELKALEAILKGRTRRILDDEDLKERFRLVYGSWLGSESEVRSQVVNRKVYDKLTWELEKLAQLTSRRRKIRDYLSQIAMARRLADAVIYRPPGTAPWIGGHELFLKEIPDLPMQLVPNGIVGWRTRMQSHLQQYPYDRSVFIMIRYRPRNAPVIKAIKSTLKAAGLSGILASEHKLTDDLYNPIACLLCCARGIAVFDEAEKLQEFNPNVAYELGMCNLLNRNCLILKHESLRALQTDILMKLYVPYSDPTSARDLVKNWVAQEFTR